MVKMAASEKPERAGKNSHKYNKSHSSRNTDVSGVLNSGAGKIKKKIRDIERLLKKDNLTADVRTNNERALKTLGLQLQKAQAVANAKEMAKKYHMVRFFERKKAIRKLKQAKTALEEAQKTEARKDIKKARIVLKHKQIDVAYVILFPKDEKYISLYPNPKDENEKTLSTPQAKKGMALTEQKKRDFRKKIETMIEEDKLPFSLDDVLAGRRIKFEATTKQVSAEEIDAPDSKPDHEDEEDDFFA